MSEPQQAATPHRSSNAVWSVMAIGDETNGMCAIVVVTLPAYDPGPPCHRHRFHAEGCYVVEGTLALTHDDQTTTLTAGSSALAPAGMTHTYWNPLATATTILLIFRPGVTETEATRLAAGIPNDIDTF